MAVQQDQLDLLEVRPAEVGTIPVLAQAGSQVSVDRQLADRVGKLDQDQGVNLR